MKISEIITDKYKLRIPPTVYYELLADVQEVEEEQKTTTKTCKTCRNYGSHNGVCDICKDYNCFTEPNKSEILTSSDNLSSGLEKNSKKLEKDFGELDCISRADVNRIICEYRDDATKTGNERDLERAYGANAVGELISELSSVTPIRPKGHWIKIGDRGFGYSDIVICKCSECEYQTEFVGKFDGHNLIVDAERADNYCSNCGADMRGNAKRKGEPIEGNNESYNCENWIP